MVPQVQNLTSSAARMVQFNPTWKELVKRLQEVCASQQARALAAEDGSGRVRDVRSPQCFTQNLFSPLEPCLGRKTGNNCHGYY